MPGLRERVAVEKGKAALVGSSEPQALFIMIFKGRPGSTATPGQTHSPTAAAPRSAQTGHVFPSDSPQIVSEFFTLIGRFTPLAAVSPQESRGYPASALEVLRGSCYFSDEFLKEVR